MTVTYIDKTMKNWIELLTVVKREKVHYFELNYITLNTKHIICK